MKKLIFLIISISLFSHCMDDKGNYDYIPSKALVVDYPNSSSTFNIGFKEYLNITPNIITEIPDEELTYNWEIFYRDSEIDFYDFIVISNEKSLTYQIINNDTIPTDGSYEIRLRLHHTVTGLDFYSDVISLNVTAGVTGLMVLHGTNTECDIALIVADPFLINANEGDKALNEYTTLNYYSSANGSKIPGKGVQVIHSMTAWTYSYNCNIYVFTEDDMRTCSYADMSLLNQNWDDLFMETPPLKNPYLYLYTDCEVLTLDRKLYSRKRQYGYAVAPFTYPILDYEISPYTSYITSRVIWFDINERNFGSTGSISNSNTGTTSSSKYSVTDYTIFNISDARADLIYMDQGGPGESYMQCVFKDDAGKLFLAQLDFSRSNYNEIARAKYDMEILTDINEAKFHAFGNRAITMNYYTTSSTIYRYTAEESIETLSSEEIRYVNGNSFSIGAGEEITFFKLLKNPNVSGTGFTFSYPYTNKMLLVGTFDGNQGRLYALELDQSSGYVNSQRIFEGFDKIIDANLKGL